MTIDSIVEGRVRFGFVGAPIKTHVSPPAPLQKIKYHAEYKLTQSLEWLCERERGVSFFKGIVSGLAKAAGSAGEQAANTFYRETQGQPLLAGRTADEWDTSWKLHGSLSSDVSQLNKSVGLYKAVMNGQTMYIGRAIEWNNGGLRKRLADYTRSSDSSRKHGSGQLMHANADALSIYILVVGSDAAASVATKALERALIGKHRPPWNKQLV